MMPVEEMKARGSPVGNFFAKLGRRVRSKSPAVSRLSTSETPKRKESRGATIDVLYKDRELDGHDTSQTPHRFGTLITRLSRRKSKKGEKDDKLVLSPDNESIPVVPQPNFGTPRPAISENDLRHVTLRRGTELDLTPLAGVSQFMSEDNLASAECGTPAYRTPSYIRISCALSGYTKSPRHLENSASRAMGRSLVERRLGLFDSSLSNRNEPPVHPNSSDKEQQQRVARSPLVMGASLSTPSPVRALIGQFDRLQLCSKDKDDVEKEKENTEPVKGSIQAAIVNQPTPTSIFISDYVEKPPLPVAESPPPVEEKEQPKQPKQPKPAEITTEPKAPSPMPKNPDMRTGEDFAQLLESVRSRLQASIKQVLSELEEVEGIPEEAASSIRIAAGKAQLLVRKKLTKFDELVKKNLNPVEGDPQPATLDDLEGYWALVEIELQDIDECFAKVDTYRANGWQLKEEPTTDQNTIEATHNNNNVTKKKVVHVRPATATPADPEARAKQAEKQKAAAEARRKALAEAKQRARAAQQQQAASEKSGDAASPDVLMVL